jgi:hypothetical protein
LRSPSYEDRPLSLSSSNRNKDEQPMTLQVPQQRPRPRSLSADSGSKLAAELEAKLNITSAAHTHKRQRSEILSWKYEDVFSPLSDSTPSPSLRLSDPITSQENPFASISIPDSSPMTPVRTLSECHVSPPTRTRRSGMIFDRESMGYFADLRESTPIVEEDEGDDGYQAITPTPAQRGSGQFDLLQ